VSELFGRKGIIAFFLQTVAAPQLLAERLNYYLLVG